MNRVPIVVESICPSAAAREVAMEVPVAMESKPKYSSAVNGANGYTPPESPPAPVMSRSETTEAGEVAGDDLGLESFLDNIGHYEDKEKRLKKIFVGGLPPNVTNVEIREHFDKMGKTESSILMMDEVTKRHRGFAFVMFEEAQIVEDLVKMHFDMINGKTVEIKKAKPREEMYPRLAPLLQRGGRPNGKKNGHASSNSRNNGVHSPTSPTGINPVVSPRGCTSGTLHPSPPVVGAQVSHPMLVPLPPSTFAPSTSMPIYSHPPMMLPRPLMSTLPLQPSTFVPVHTVPMYGHFTPGPSPIPQHMPPPMPQAIPRPMPVYPQHMATGEPGSLPIMSPLAFQNYYGVPTEVMAATSHMPVLPAVSPPEGFVYPKHNQVVSVQGQGQVAANAHAMGTPPLSLDSELMDGKFSKVVNGMMYFDPKQQAPSPTSDMSPEIQGVADPSHFPFPPIPVA